MVNKNSQSYNLWPDFYEHPFIKRIADTKKWTISLPENKMPIDMFNLKYYAKITGCVPDTPHSMETLANSIEITEKTTGSPPINHAFNMDMNQDNFIVIDVEPKCPTGLKTKFKKLPYLYAEKSMSGKGYHIIMPIPKEYFDYPALFKLQKMQEKHKFYEIMFSHWITFTRDMLPPAPTNADDTFFKQIFKELAEKQIEYDTTELDFEMDDNHNIETSDIPGADEIIAYATNGANEYKRPLKDYENDASSFIFGASGHFYNVMSKLMKASFIQKFNHEYTPQEQTRILYAIIKDRVPDRPKNHEKRGNTTWLMAQCKKMVGLRLGDKKGKEAKHV